MRTHIDKVYDLIALLVLRTVALGLEVGVASGVLGELVGDKVDVGLVLSDPVPVIAVSLCLKSSCLETSYLLI